MSSLTDAEVHRYIEEIVGGVHNIERRLGKDVRGMCNLVLDLVLECRARLSNEGYQRLKQSFKDIYGSLKLHLKFHSRAVEPAELKTLGEKIGLTAKELNELPNKECVIDPGSKLLEILSDLTEYSRHSGPKGSESHANAVMTQAKGWLERLTKKSTFRPKVLTMVSHNDKWFVGSSMAVSHFLRPLCLYKRIRGFKQSLKKAVVNFQPLETGDNVQWNSSSLWFTDGYKTEIRPCGNCRHIFENLNGFLDETDILKEKGASANTVPKSFLAACGEYPPINRCLPDDVETSLEHKADKKVNDALIKFRKKCDELFEDFERVASECFRAYESKDVERLRNVYYTDVKPKIHIFGIKPECNRSLNKP